MQAALVQLFQLWYPCIIYFLTFEITICLVAYPIKLHDLPTDISKIHEPPAAFMVSYNDTDDEFIL